MHAADVELLLGEAYCQKDEGYSKGKTLTS